MLRTHKEYKSSSIAQTLNEVVVSLRSLQNWDSSLMLLGKLATWLTRFMYVDTMSSPSWLPTPSDLKVRAEYQQMKTDLRCIRVKVLTISFVGSQAHPTIRGAGHYFHHLDNG